MDKKTPNLDQMNRQELHYLAKELIEENEELKGNYYPNIVIMILIIVSFTVGLLLGVFGRNF